jgi:hypothetical protein
MLRRFLERMPFDTTFGEWYDAEVGGNIEGRDKVLALLLRFRRTQGVAIVG